MATLTISIVSFAPEIDILQETLDSLGQSLGYAHDSGELGAVVLFLIDNGPDSDGDSLLRTMIHTLAKQYEFLTCHLLTGHGNVGFGAGHNLAIKQNEADFYLVLNPDVFFNDKTIFNALRVLATHDDVGLLAPFATDQSGGNQYLCKRYPSILDLILRAFAPLFIKKMFRRRLSRYKMTDLYVDDQQVADVAIASGCFMFFRSSILKALNGFSERYFLYFEDFDLSLRAGTLARTIYAPSVRVIHLGGHASRKSFNHILLFGRAGCIFFWRHGWKLW